MFILSCRLRPEQHSQPSGSRSVFRDAISFVQVYCWFLWPYGIQLRWWNKFKVFIQRTRWNLDVLRKCDGIPAPFSRRRGPCWFFLITSPVKHTAIEYRYAPSASDITQWHHPPRAWRLEVKVPSTRSIWKQILTHPAEVRGRSNVAGFPTWFTSDSPPKIFTLQKEVLGKKWQVKPLSWLFTSLTIKQMFLKHASLFWVPNTSNSVVHSFPSTLKIGLA